MLHTSQDYWGIDFAVSTSSWQFANYASVDVILKTILPTDILFFTNQESIGAHRSNYLPQEQWQVLYEAYRQGMDYNSLARRFGISIRAVQYGIRDEKIQRGLPTRKADRNRI
jgi:hypothetical protein